MMKYFESKKIRILVSFFIVFICITLSGLSFSILKDIGQKGTILGFDFIPNLDNDINSSDENPADEDAVFVPQGPTAEPWNGNDRVTLLLLGLDYRDVSSGETASRSDTMILLTIDPISKEAGMLSVPRDLWANIPGFNPGKINTAYYLGDIYKLPGGGPKLAIDTIEQTIGVPIDYYAQIDFSTFERFIDLIGGITIDVKTPLRIDPIGPKLPVTLELGRQTLPGYLALAYARMRYTEGGDFTRSERQQEVILAIRDRFLEPDNFTRLLNNATDIYDEISSGINTNLPLDDALKLIVLAAQIDFENIKSGVIDEKYVNFGTSPDGLSILIPVPDLIRTLRDDIFGSGGVFSPLTVGDDQTKMNLELSNIYIENSSNSPELESRTSDYLTSLGAHIAGTNPTNQFSYTSTIIDHTGNPFTAQFLLNLFGNQVIIYHRFDPNSAYDIELFLGNDWATNNPLP
ncbi:MAG: LCP family protein [Chloroflexi bacterium]|jgi:polyisoprenyl-teichoic acid--peptidoglycan teichoic acid transferase|nr:LCP family protein [Chloroflexota bacterium]MBT4003837.1 LCP family protein [Chloroflexota bacterium]MBT4305861.1 LCP family protein [Chloroflexota bacterium]MBT4533686.1 LCP family protein [Chloroflexota bacterium]MBT4681671.1 LCP family protein [Chloroflexota bacterium]